MTQIVVPTIREKQGKSNINLSRQYDLIYETVEQYRPELCLKICQCDLEEFHHILWDLPFYKKFYLVDTRNRTMKLTTEVYCQVTDPYLYTTELFRLNRWTVSKNIFGVVSVSTHSSLCITSDDFMHLFVKLLTMHPIAVEQLPRQLRDKI